LTPEHSLIYTIFTIYITIRTFDTCHGASINQPFFAGLHPSFVPKQPNNDGLSSLVDVIAPAADPADGQPASGETGESTPTVSTRLGSMGGEVSGRGALVDRVFYQNTCAVKVGMSGGLCGNLKAGCGIQSHRNLPQQCIPFGSIVSLSSRSTAARRVYQALIPPSPVENFRDRWVLGHREGEASHQGPRLVSSELVICSFTKCILFSFIVA